MAIRLLDKMRRQVAVYWAPNGTDDNGNPVWASPAELRVRWEDVAENFVGPSGETRVSRSKVYVGESDPVAEGGVFWLGALAAVSGPGLTNPFTLAHAYQISVLQRIPTLDAKQTLVVAIL